MKKLTNVHLKSLDGKAATLPSGKPATLDEAIRFFVLSIPAVIEGRPVLTMEDSIRGASVYDQIEKTPNGTLELADADHDWLEKKVEQFGPLLFGMHAVRFREAIRPVSETK